MCKHVAKRPWISPCNNCWSCLLLEPEVRGSILKQVKWNRWLLVDCHCCDICRRGLYCYELQRKVKWRRQLVVRLGEIQHVLWRSELILIKLDQWPLISQMKQSRHEYYLYRYYRRIFGRVFLRIEKLQHYIILPRIYQHISGSSIPDNWKLIFA